MASKVSKREREMFSPRLGKGVLGNQVFRFLCFHLELRGRRFIYNTRDLSNAADDALATWPASSLLPRWGMDRGIYDT